MIRFHPEWEKGPAIHKVRWMVSYAVVVIGLLSHLPHRLTEICKNASLSTGIIRFVIPIE